MKRTVSLLLLAAVALPAFAQAPKWAPFGGKAEGFTVLMPAKPRIMNQAMEGVTTKIYIGMSQPFVCIVSKSDLPPNYARANIDAMKKAMRSSMMQSAGATETGTVKATHDGLVGEQMSFKTRTGGNGLTWIAATPRTFYSVTMAGKKALSPADTKKFLDSFHRK